MKPGVVTPGVASGAARSDAELLDDVARGSVVALGQLYDRHARDVWRAVLRVTNGSPDAEDIVHATFLKLPAMAKSFDGRASCRAWLCGIAVNLALHESRAVRRFRAVLARFAHAPPAASPVDPEAQSRRNRDVVAFERALATLAPKKRAVFVLVELEGLSHEEVAMALGVPAATVRTRLFHAKEQLRDVMTKGGME